MKEIKVGRCHVDWDTLELVVNGAYPYHVDLERCNTAAQVLDWIMQVAGKTWCDGQLLHDLVECLDRAFYERFGTDVQGGVCPWGVSHRVNWRTGRSAGSGSGTFVEVPRSAGADN
jgi:hypothetical protein